MAKVHMSETTHTGLDKIDRYRWRDKVKDAPGVLRMINKRDLLIDDSYQRPTVATKVRAIQSDWSWAWCGALTVCRRSDGSYYVVDGQHRLVAAMSRSDVQDLPCVVFESLGAHVEAGVFLGSNALRKPVTALEKFNARLVSRDEAAEEVAHLAASIGRKVLSGSGPTTIHCVSMVSKCLLAHPEETRRLFPLLGELMSGRAFKERVLHGFVKLETALDQGQSLTDKRWRARVIQVGIEEIERSITASALFHGNNGERAIAIGVLRAINRGLRTQLKASKLTAASGDAAA